ncbi:dynamin family protein [Clostridium sp.]|uniref:dynamin family protein n=1 Tax=Clostridium sp. TaxID=1506 RepID=UPI003D6C7FB7
MNISKLQSMTTELVEKYELQQIKNQLDNIKQEKSDVKIALLGEFSSGKTTLINALIGKKILPTFNEPTTAVITEIVRSEENKCYVLSNNEYGEDVKKEIYFGEIAEEVTKSDLNKKLILELKDVEFLNEGFMLVDTPGVSSIDDIHEDVTYGYLPLVDVAFILMNVQFGAITKSLLHFLNQLPKDQLTKIYFVLNFIDTMPASEIESLKKSFEDGLSSITDSPKVVLISAKQALVGKTENNEEVYNKSGVLQIEKIIKDDILEYKREIEEKKLANKFKEVLVNIKDILRFKINNLDWNSDEEDKLIKQCHQDINKIKRDIEKIEREFDGIKNQVLNSTIEFINGSVESISVKITKADKDNVELNIDSEIQIIVEGVEGIVNSGLSRIKNIKIDSINRDIGNIISNSVNKEVSKIKDVVDMITDIATFIASVFVFPGQSVAMEVGELSAGAAMVGSQKVAKAVKEVAKTSKVLEGLKFIGYIMRECNPLEKIKRYSLPYIINPKLRSVLRVRIINSLECMFDELQDAINEEIENNHLNIIKQKEDIVRNNIDTKKKKIVDNDNIKMEIEEDINNIIKAI